MSEEMKYDTPLSTPDDDILGRKRFAENLAKSIIGIEASQGFVYGLYGPWGSGKSTVINFIEYYIKEHNEKPGAETKIVVFRFNPWMFSGSENLTKFYLDQLRARLSMDDVCEELQKVSKGLDLLESALSFAVPIANVIIPASGNVLNALKDMFSSTKKIANSASETLKKDIHQIKMEITAALQNQQDKVLVVIDDLDRLFDDEIKDFVKMIKAVCDFPKIIYLIACDSDKVANALNRNRDDNADGYDYLEKIVQCSFNIPRPDKNGLHQLFSIELDQILEPLKNQELLFNANDWGNIFHDGVAPRLKTPRNVKTLINSIAACYSAVRDEVNVADFVGIQVLRVFYPKAYALIDHNKEYMLGSTNDVYGSDNRMKVWESFYEQLHKEVPESDLNDFKALMGRMFPKYAQIVSNGMGYGSDFLAKWKQQRRVRSEECFDLYFTLSIPEDSFSLEEMQTIIALADEPDILKERLRRLIECDKSTKKGRYQTFLGELEDFTGEIIPVKKIKPLLQAIYDLSDEVGSDFDYRSFFGH
ncbi:MAG: KAP family P-loop NTPase fold protein [Acidimicrobiales bacterium]